ncbi:hypothetical protein MMC25_003171 [Agyrium rufum]|nr:hypothetical protein [Agyrium rufum]
MTKLTIVFVPGLWEGSSVFFSLATTLQQEGYEAVTAELVSSGTSSPGNPSLHDDVAAIRKVIAPLIEIEGKDVLLVLHSAGGFLGSNAIQGLTAKAREAEEKKGGVFKIVFLTAGVAPVGFKHEPLPFFNIQGDKLFGKDPKALLFNDLLPEGADAWAAKSQHQPAKNCEETIAFAGWKEVPSRYLIYEGDAVLPTALQMQFAQLAGSEITTCSAGHMVMLSQPQKVLEVIREAAGK